MAAGMAAYRRWKVMVLALTLRSFSSTLLPTSTMGTFSHTRTKSLCQVATLL